MRRAALAILFVLLFVTQKAAQDDDRADTTFNLGKSWLLGLSGVLVGHFICGMGRIIQQLLPDAGICDLKSFWRLLY